MTLSNVYTTKDTAFATYLILKNYQLIRIDYTQSRYEYHFAHDNGIEEHASDYFNGKSLADPAEFMRVNRKLVGVIHNKAQWVEL